MTALALAFAKSSSSSSVVAKAITFNRASAMASKPRKPKMREWRCEPYMDESQITGQYVDTGYEFDGWVWVTDSDHYRRALKKHKQALREYKLSKEAWAKYRQEMREWRAKFPLEAL